jgi:hypothetical protein
MNNKLFGQRSLFCTTSRRSEHCDDIKMGLPKNDSGNVSRHGKDGMSL